MEIRKTKLGLHSGELAGRGGGEEGGLHVLCASSVLPCTLPSLDGCQTPIPPLGEPEPAVRVLSDVCDTAQANTLPACADYIPD